MACTAVPQSSHFTVKKYSGMTFSSCVFAGTDFDTMAKCVTCQFTMLVWVFTSAMNEACSAFPSLFLFLCGDRQL